MIRIKRYEELTIQDNFLFQKVMQNTYLCKHFLEMALRIKIRRIIYPIVPEKNIKLYWAGKGIRLDLYVELEDGTIIDVEIQTTGNKKELAKRMRYYQSLIDASVLEKGQKYTELKPSYIIFICTFDPFGENRFVYTFRNRCVESDGLELNDGTTKIFFNAKGTIGDIDDSLKNFLTYIDDGEIKDDFIRDVADELTKVKLHKGTRADYMTFSLTLQEYFAEGRAAGEAEGRAEGEAKGRAEGLQKGETKGRELALLASIKNVAANAKTSLEDAMQILGIPADERSHYAKLLAES